MLTRRSFLQALGIGVAAAAVPAIILPERRIWQVGVSAPVRGVDYVHGYLDELEDAVQLRQAWGQPAWLNSEHGLMLTPDGGSIVADPSKFLSPAELARHSLGQLPRYDFATTFPKTHAELQKAFGEPSPHSIMRIRMEDVARLVRT